MAHKISSTVSITSRGCEMKHRDNTHKSKGKSAGKSHTHHYQSKATSDKNRLFHHVKGRNNGVTQEVNVDVKIEQEDGCVTNCLAGLMKLFRG